MGPLLRLTTAPVVAILCLLAGSWVSAATDEECSPGMLGRPLASLKECRAERLVEPPECCAMPSDSVERDAQIECFVEDHCPHVAARYKACDGPIGAFALDSDDNVYFWSGRWHLQSLTPDGELRWRRRFCPGSRRLCGEERCDDERGALPGMVMSFWDVGYFFIGNVLYGVDSTGEIAIRQSVRLPHSKTVRQSGGRVALSSGVRPRKRGARPIVGGHPVLTERGTLVAAYRYFVPEELQGEEDPFGENFATTGIVELNRRGRILQLVPIDAGVARRIRIRSLVGVDEQTVMAFGARLPVGDHERSLTAIWSASIRVDTGTVRHRTVLPPVHLNPDFKVHDFMTSSPAVTSGGRAVGSGRYGNLYGFASEKPRSKLLMEYPSTTVNSTWNNRPVTDGEGNIFFVVDPIPPGASSIWAVRDSELWKNPLEVESWSESIGAHPGVEWLRSSSGAGSAGFGTPMIDEGGTLYAPLGGVWAADKSTGEPLWKLGSRTPATSPISLSDGTLVAAQGQSTYVTFLKRGSEQSHLRRDGWPVAYHDRYQSNHASHPHIWDRSQPSPYPRRSKLEKPEYDRWSAPDSDAGLSPDARVKPDSTSGGNRSAPKRDVSATSNTDLPSSNTSIRYAPPAAGCRCSSGGESSSDGRLLVVILGLVFVVVLGRVEVWRGARNLG